MAHFAKIGLNNKVIEVQVVSNEVLKDSNGAEQEVNGIDFLTKLTGYPVWKQTSYNGNLRKNFASIGMIYDENRDAFITSKPFNSWVLNEDTCKYEAPIAKPTDGKIYKWNETNLNWEVIE